jgi:hypothetical protein
MTGSTLVLDPSAVSWAVLGGNFPGMTAIQATLVGSCANLYLLASDYSSGRWKLVAGPLSTDGSFALPAGVMRADDSTFLALLCTDNASCSLTVSLLLDDGLGGPPQPVSGAVRTEADVAVVGATLTLSGDGNFQTTSSPSGSFTFPAVPPGNYQLSASLADHAFTPAVQTLKVAAAPLNAQTFIATLDIDLVPYEFRIDIGDPEKVVIRPQKGINIDVFVQPGIAVPGWQASFDTEVKQAVLNWNPLSDPWGLFHIRVTEVEAEAEIVVSWIETFNNGGQMGLANVSFFSDGTVDLPYTIQLATKGEDITADDELVRKVAVHELGHCLGLWDHSSQSTDIMFPSVSTFEIPSRRDLWTVYTLYNTPADFTTGGRGPSFIGPRIRRTVQLQCECQHCSR